MKQSDRKGGFDVVLGNPPWERVKLQEKEFFAERDPEVAAAHNAAARRKLITKLKDDQPALHTAFLDAKRLAEGVSHLLRNSGRYPLCGRGDVNTYQIFAELNRTVIGRGGRAGYIVPSGIATDDTTKHFFRDLIEVGTLASLYDFENRKALFPEVDSRMKFCLLTLRDGAAADSTAAQFAFFLYDVRDLTDPERVFSLTAEDIALLNPNTRTCPIFRSRRDAEITKAIYRRVPVLIREADPEAGTPEENPWGFDYMTKMFDMADSSHEFVDVVELDLSTRTALTVDHRGIGRLTPLYEAKHVNHFDHRWDLPESDTYSRDGHYAKRDPSRLPAPRYWISFARVLERLASKNWAREWVVGWRDITNVTNERTAIAAVIPRTGVAHTFRVAFSTQSPIDVAGFVACLSSFALDFIARQKTGGTHLTVETLLQLAIAPPEIIRNHHQLLLPRVLELTYTAWDLQAFAKDCSYDGPPFVWDEERRFEIRCELDAAFFHLYGIERDDVDYIMDTFPIVKRKDEQKHGTYRTKDQILEIYDQMAEGQHIGQPYLSALNPRPGPPTDEAGNFIPMAQWDSAQWPPHIHPARDAVRLRPTIQVEDGVAVLYAIALLRTWQHPADRRSFELGMILMQKDALRQRVLRKETRVTAGHGKFPNQITHFDELIGELVGSQTLAVKNTDNRQLISLGPAAPSIDDLSSDSTGRSELSKAEEAVQAVAILSELNQSLNLYAEPEDYGAVQIAIS